MKEGDRGKSMDQRELMELIYNSYFILHIHIGFKLQSQVLARMFFLVETGAVQAPLFNPSAVSDPNMTNAQFMREYMINLLQNAFPHLQP